MTPEKIVLSYQYSPTGEPVLPQWLIRPITILVIMAGSVQPFLETGHWTQQAALVVIALGAGFGIYSQGARK
jgi:hypothetical protein